MAELERQASISESPEEPPVTEATRRSITSSALTSLLPIATASGIVQPNFDTPKISFYSPSGRLIQPEGSSSPETGAAHCSSPTVKVSIRNRPGRHSARQTLTAPACLPPARPNLLPMTTLPTSTAPLPLHLRHHHNYRHPERSQIESCESLLDNTVSVKGCDGVIRTSSFTLRSGTRRSPLKKKNPDAQQNGHQSTKSLLHDIRGEVSFYKSRYIALAAQSCGPTHKSTCKKGATLHKRRTREPRTSKPHSSTSDKNTRMQRTFEKSVLGPLVGHALRVCFCQPYDGAGTPGPSCTTQHESGAAKKEASRVIENEVIARPVVGKENATRGSKGVGSARMRVDSGASVGGGSRNATARR
jgi:hypothetical protein